MSETVNFVDPRETQAATLRAASVRLFIGAACIVLPFIVLHTLALPSGPSGTAVVLALDIVLFAYALVITYVFWRKQPSLDAGHLLVYGFVLVGVINAEISAFVFGDEREVAYTGMYLVGMGALLYNPLGTALVGVFAVLSSVTLAYTLPVRGATLFIGAASCSGFIIGATIFLGRANVLARELGARAREQDLAAHKAALEAQLRQAQKLEALGTLAGGIAHDLNNVLASIVGVAETAAEEQPEGSQEREDFDSIVSAAQRGAALTRNLLGFAQRGKHRHERFSLNSTIENIVVVVQRTTPKHIEVVAELDEDADCVEGDPNQMGHVVMNLCLNAIEAMPEGGTLTIRTTSETTASGRCAVLRVSDTGTGMDAETQARAFEPFFTTKTSSGGSGLGLPMVYGTVKEHRGDVRIETAVDKGTTILVSLPLAAGPVSKHAPSHGRAAKPDASQSPILVIDDDPDVRRVFRRMLGPDASIVEAASGAEGIERYSSAVTTPSAPSLVILDLAMPGMTGAECFTRLRAIDPEVPIAIVSGFPKDQRIAPLLASGNVEFLAKPFQREDLLAMVDRLRRD